MNKIKEYISKCLKGEEKLWVVFWIWFVIIGLIFAILSEVSFAFLSIVNLTNEYSFIVKTLGIIITVLFLFFTAIYSLWILVSLIKCRKNVKNPVWTKVLICFFVIIILLSIGESIFSPDEEPDITEMVENAIRQEAID